MRVLIACECSGAVRDAFIKLGHDAISCDLKETNAPGPHYTGSVFDIIDNGFDLMIAHPPCTYLTVTANKWLKDQPERKSGALVGQARRDARRDSYEFFMKLALCSIPKVCIENPVGAMSSLWREPDQIIQPFNFGHKEAKKTCLWLKNLPKLEHTHKQLKPTYVTFKSGKRMAEWYVNASKNNAYYRSEIRSNTFQGIADAMADQWTKPYLTLF